MHVGTTGIEVESLLVEESIELKYLVENPVLHKYINHL